jgi:flagellar motor protein MotB
LKKAHGNLLLEPMPKASNATKEGRAANRRVEIKVAN